MGSFFVALNRKDFALASTLLTQGENIDFEDYEYNDYTHDDPVKCKEKFYYLAEAFAKDRFDIAEFLLSNRANPFICIKEILSLLEKTRHSPTFQERVLTTLFSSRIDGNTFCGKTDDYYFNNFFHLLSKKFCVSIDERRCHHMPFDSGASQNPKRYDVFFNFSFEQLNSIFKNVQVDNKILNKKNREGNSAAHLAVANENIALFSWMVQTGKLDLLAENNIGENIFDLVKKVSLGERDAFLKILSKNLEEKDGEVKIDASGRKRKASQIDIAGAGQAGLFSGKRLAQQGARKAEGSIGFRF